MVWPLVLGAAGAAAPWLMRGAPGIGRGAQALWNMGKGLGSAGGRQRAGQAIWGRGTPPGRPGFDPSGMPIPGTPGTPRGVLPRAGDWMQANPIKSSVGLGAAGMLAPGMFEGDPEQQAGGDVPMPIMPPGYGPQGAEGFTSDLPSYSERMRAKRTKYLENMSTITQHAMLLQFQNPGKKNAYMKDAIEMLKGAAMMDNEVEVAAMIDQVFKDKKVPKTAKTIYSRMIAAGASPKEASAVSGYSLDIEKTAAKAAADYARANDPSKLMSKDEMKWQRILRMAQTDLDSAATELAQAWGAGLLDLPEQFAGYEQRDFQQMKSLALELLSGGPRGGMEAGGSGILTIDKS